MFLCREADVRIWSIGSAEESDVSEITRLVRNLARCL